ncbi:hypothetical protein L3X38_036440 [Prunus dulcis]|uniref:Uncharacterized protein n=1 Tax=Prunus dulcis TaxID=3755 RepID=A0AAD4YQD1_PRUDU|nr:hypothetical protein L3X38_036440 [Prunus dulcis]
MPVWREVGAGQPVYGYLDWCTVEYINMLEMWEQVKLLGHMGKVSFKGVVNDELLDIDTDGELLSLCDKVPLSYEIVVLIYVQHIEEEGVTVNEDCEEVGVVLNEDSEEEGMALNEDSEEEDSALNEDIGLVTDENRAFIEGSGPLNNDKEGKTDVEDRNKESEEEDKEDDLDFIDSAYEQSENECELLRKDNKAFENYVDPPEVVEDPNALVDEDGERWDIIGIPCKNACAAIGQLNRDHIAYVDACYKKKAFMRVYRPMVHPMTSEDLWPKCHKPPLMPPFYHKQPGRPRKKRMRPAGEQPRKSNPTTTKLQRYNLETKCSIYRQGSHNRKSCPKAKECTNSQCSEIAQSSQNPHGSKTAQASQTAPSSQTAPASQTSQASKTAKKKRGSSLL